mmetsp:Transcript_2315/g.3976  ORF Transcript_2315/g.3976 Transcript_2315/m.3976 type:complete len:740 (-) Transcript_2315:32-2251(-)|eukprot:scaffold9751_cov153-Skeletonema_menzelii.AAC.10
MMISFKEVFCSELPSPSNIFLSSSSSHKTNSSISSGLCYQFASERHSLTLQTSHNAREDGGYTSTLPKKNNVYKLIVERLLQNSKQSKPPSSTTTATTTTCVAHSSLQTNNILIQAFAIRTRDFDCNNNSSSYCSHDDQATVTTNATTTTTNNKESTVNNGHFGDGSNNGDMITSGEQGTIPSSSSKYALMIKYHPFVNTDKGGKDDNATTRATAKSERISLDFRPISVHLTDIHSSSTSSSSVPIIPLIGVYVAGDDNKLHFFVATLQSLKEKLVQEEEEENVKEAKTTSITTKSEYALCFQSSCCFETIDPSNIISASESYDLSSKESVDNKPLEFATPIMAIDARVSEGHGNIIAVACYDGVIRILTYIIECTSDLNVIRMAKLQHSTFIVDGPVTTLHFHNEITKNSGRISHSGASEEEDDWCDNLFLLAGSLCGLAFLFYEVSPQTAEGKSFEGPVVVVDGLYDADKEGCEDCVTAVHVMRYHDVTILAVGTLGCRLVMFQRQQQNNSTENEARKEHVKHKTLLTAEIESKSEEMMHLSFERDRLTHVVSDLSQKLLELENSDQEEDVIHGDAIFTRSGSGIDNDGGEDDVKSNQRNRGCLSIAPRVERLSSIKAEIDETEQSRSNCTSMISQLQSSIDSLTHKLNDLSVPSPQDSKLVRQLHRYEYLLEHKLAYPIQGIGSDITQSGDLECYVTTGETIHIFRLLSSHMVDAAAVSLERKLLSFSKTTEDGKS